MIGGLGGLLGGGGGALSIGKKLLGGLFGGGKKKKLKKKLKAMKQQMQQMAQQMQQMKAHMGGFKQGVMAAMGMKNMQGCGQNQMNLACASFQQCAMPQTSFNAVSVSMSMSSISRGIC